MWKVMEPAQGQKWKSRIFSIFPNPEAWEAGGLGAHLSSSVGCRSGLSPIGSVLEGVEGDSGAVGREDGLREGCRWPVD